MAPCYTLLIYYFTAIERVSNPNYVCTICSQTFTRRWRGSVHNNKFHGGVGSVVRLLDYIVGRACGQYLPGDPSSFRRKNKWTVSPNSNRELEDTTLKMAELKKLTSEYFPPDEVQGILFTVEMQCKMKGSNIHLDQAIE